ncbi:hypothetical protein PLICRDRAFT_176496 [Plicaturopsis crispa FD-325 SS-3]|nr:hypothetical protein PLICRDRAFT_176496 [Plicaturopsis crispa FD-325 SS-3]
MRSQWFIGIIILFTSSLLGLVAGSLLSDIESALENAIDCASCHALLLPLQALAHLGNDPFVGTVVAVCQTFELEDADVCAGAIGEQGPILAHALRGISATGNTATKFCDAVFGLCQAPAVAAFSVPLPARSTPALPLPTSVGREPFQVIHFSDVHIDREYTPNSEANCTKPICCRDFADQANETTTEPAGPNGNAKCDSPVTLADSMLEAAQRFGAGARFTIFTGDVVEGAVWLVNKTEVTGDLQDFNSEMASELSAPVYPVIGNHDTAPVNSFPRNTTSTTIDSQWVFDTQSADWTQWIGSVPSSQVDHTSGSYSIVPPGTNLRILSVNTQYWYKQNFWLYDSDDFQPDPNGILAFMVQELQAAEDAGQRAWIIGHMPLGKNDALHDQSNYYNQVIQRYNATIAGQFFGHSHKDQFEIAYSDYGDQSAETADGMAWIAPALTPTSGNPAFKIYDVDPDTYEIMDARVYMTNVSSPTFQTTPTWELYYSARSTYGPLVPSLTARDPLGPAFWHNVTEVFAANDTAFHMYNTFLSRGGDVSACEGDCKTNAICDMRALRAENNCDVATPGISFKRRDVETASNGQHRDACEGAGIAPILVDLVARASAKKLNFTLLEAKLAPVLGDN